MTLPSHFLVGVAVGSITGHYPAAIITSVVFDLDHLFFYYTRNLLFRPLKVLTKALEEKVYIKGQRGIFHSIFSLVAISTIFLLIDFSLGMTVFLAYFFHLLLDALDESPFYPFYPLKKMELSGPVIYASFGEVTLLVLLGLAYYLIINFII